MIQDICAEYDRGYAVKQPKPTDPVLCCRGREVCVRGTAPLEFPTAADFASSALTYLFRVDGEDYFLAPEEDGRRFSLTMNRPALRKASPQSRAFAAMTGMHLDYWYARSRFCGRCGSRMTPSAAERAMVCPACGETVYPVIAPAVIIGVVDRGRILVSHYANRPYGGMALLAGYCEIGETPEDTVRREVMEEVGLKVTRTVYAGSQPWGFDHDLLMGYYCEVEPGAIRVDHQELKDAYWLRREEIGTLGDTASLTFDMLARYRDGFEPFPAERDFSVCHARLEDLPEIMRVYDQARAFMAAHGNPRQWGASHWPPEALIRQDIARGRSYVCEADGLIQGVFYYDFGADAEAGYRRIEQGAWSADEPYGVVHRMASAGHRRGVGRFILGWALAQAGYLRIDTHPDNTVMQGLLGGMGFVRRGIIHVTEDNDPRFAYERREERNR